MGVTRPATGAGPRVPGAVRRLGLRWVHLLQGGALLMPFFLLTVVGMGVVRPSAGRVLGAQLAPQFLAYALSLPLVALAGLLPLVRTLESAAARALCGVPAAALAQGPAGSWAARRRSAVWFTLHAGVGALVSGASLAVPPMAAVLLAFPLVPALRGKRWLWPWHHAGDALWTAPAAGAALLAGLVAVVYGAGALLARCAPVLLGPAPADRLAAAEARAAALAARNRLARDLHDSVGHALSTVALQAGAARRVLEADPAFVQEALAAIEETSRGAVADLDTVLGVLRDGRLGEQHAEADGPTLASSLDGLLARTRATGTVVDLSVDAAVGPLALLDSRVSAEAFRVVQEGLHNALRHAPGTAVHVRVATQRAPRGDVLALTLTNAVHAERPARPSRRGGGRGLTGIAERAAALGGTADACDEAGTWRLTARLPLTPRTQEVTS
ncbi:histidine kinase [Streptomyces diacarni]|uniref:histidine kinase n=1 Tax=Streptomyces diacarni TaxID=2800381 RepID=A0A367FB15_9ACTN|nr:histidine kinase [Streptomyces diacarni]RCG26750.1 histidine kinase [Streptomyces diacarni]